MIVPTQELRAEKSALLQESESAIPAARQSSSRGAFAATVLDQGLVSSANFALVVLIGRKLGPSGLGVFTLLWSGVFCLNLLQQCFFVAPMLTLQSRFDDQERRGYFGGVALFQLVFGVVAAAAFFIGAKLITRALHLSAEIDRSALPLAVAVLAFQFQEFCRRALQACKRPFHALASDLLAYGVLLALVFKAGTYWPASLMSFIWCMAIGWTVGCLVLFALSEDLQFGNGSVKWILRSHTQFGSPLAANSFFQWCGAYGALYLAAAALAPSAVGNIRAVINIVAPLNVFALGIQTFLSIEAAEAFRGFGMRAMERLLFRSTLKFVAVCTITGLSLAAFSKHIFSLLFGAAFSVDTASLLLTFVAVVLGAIYGFLVVYFKTIGRPGFAALSAVVSTIVSLIVLIILLPVLASKAVFLSLAINQIFACLLAAILIARSHSNRNILELDYQS